MGSNKDDFADLDELAAVIHAAEKIAKRNDRTARVRSSRSRNDTPLPAGAQGTEKQMQNHRMWAVFGERNYHAIDTAVEAFPAGQYTINHNDTVGTYFRHETINLDELMILPDSKSEQVIQEIKRFWSLEERFRSFGFLWKRGVMLWGPPGSGKTSTLQIISKDIVDLGGISIYVDDPNLASGGLKILREVEPTRPVVIMLEDIDSIIDEYGESSLLALMDGELQIDNVVFVATTNYPERLDKRFINRPSRFDIVKKIGMPSKAARTVYLKAKNKRLDTTEGKVELANWVSSTKGFSIAHLKELIISVEVFGQPLADAIARLRKMGTTVSSSQVGSTSFGFTGAATNADVED